MAVQDDTGRPLVEPRWIRGPLDFGARGSTVWRKALRRVYMSKRKENDVVAGFRAMYVAAMPPALWMGEPISTLPLDLWIYHEIVHRTRPELIIAVDTSSASYLADVCRMTGNGWVLAIYANSPQRAVHDEHLRVLEGSALASETWAMVEEFASRHETALVLLGSGLDTDEDSTYLLAQLRTYSPLVNVGGYLIVEDMLHPTSRSGQDEPSLSRSTAVSDFLLERPPFIIDQTAEKLFMTYNHGGFLRRVP